ncbi:S-adenosyl-L-methionine-dependent methyltransferase [Podospora aff. communis PSN243]|uniref:S-adenosyl-L-methionine-dependent methyltransferase n=1 Tax=Podospora aff. communis PSN243 TaxID=3040156 RepID=A0AAV9GYS6_9PEZI|nr:S-adenosyl-L-methionine-dependent methyltransferase [Podospora aff. communis PSN243]
MQWLDPQPNDTILDLGCGDGVLDVQIGHILSRGSGSLHGIDASPSMIESARKATTAANLSERLTFAVLDVTALPSPPDRTYDKIFSNAAMHWILRPPSSREKLFTYVRDALVPGGQFVFEMGGLGNVVEVRAAILSALARRVGMARAREADPWFFPDEEWVREMVRKVGGMEVVRVEREWRPTDADKGGIEGWVRLMGREFMGVVEDEGEREECVKEVVDVLEAVCGKPGGGWMFSYVRLRAVVRKL